MLKFLVEISNSPVGYLELSTVNIFLVGREGLPYEISAISLYKLFLIPARNFYLKKKKEFSQSYIQEKKTVRKMPLLIYNNTVFHI